MSAKTNAFESALLKHIFQNLAIANIGDATGLPASATAGSLYVSLHTADPGEAGTQTTSEIAYTGYARVAVARAAGSWAESNGVVSNVAAITFPEATGGSGTATWIGIGTAASGAGTLLFKGLATQSLAVSTGISPTINAGTLTITED
jgi:hypothetical protein